MKKLFSIGEAAKIAGMTSETLRHYDRIGLVTPGHRDPWTNYRRYTEQDILLLHTVRALQQMDLPLKKIKEVLAYQELQKIIDFLLDAEKKADEKIASLRAGKQKIKQARQVYENKLRIHSSAEEWTVKQFPERVILLSDTLREPSLDNLWDYLSSFYAMLPSDQREEFEFEDLAGIYTLEDQSRLFAVCIRHGESDHLRTLPEGSYLCAACEEDTRADTVKELLNCAKEKYRVEPDFTVQQILVSGILRWNYEVQIFLGETEIQKW